MLFILLQHFFCVINIMKLFILCPIRPQNGSMILYNRKKVKYRKDGYCWKKRKDGKTTREDHMKLKVQGVEVRGCDGKNKSMIVLGAEHGFTPNMVLNLLSLTPRRRAHVTQMYTQTHAEATGQYVT